MITVNYRGPLRRPTIRRPRHLARSIPEGLLLLLVTVDESGIFADVAPTNGGADADGFEEYLDGSCSAATSKN